MQRSMSLRAVWLCLSVTACRAGATVSESASIAIDFPTLMLSTNEDSPVTLMGQATLIGVSSFSIDLTAAPVHGQVTSTLDGASITLTYTPDAHYSGTDSFTLVATDGGATQSVPLTFAVAIAHVDAALMASDDAVQAAQAATLFTTLLQNDSDADAVSVTVATVDATSALGATLTRVNDSTVRYDPTTSATLRALLAGQATSDSFHYTATSDTKQMSTALVTVAITATNHLPSLVATTGCAPGDAFIAATDVDGDALTVTVTAGSCPADLGRECPALGTACSGELSVSDGLSVVTGPLSLTANTIFTAAGATGDGSSWTAPTGDLQGALDNAAGRHVWSMQGAFQPTAQLTLTVDGTVMRGGFAGHEVYLSERGEPFPLTVLDGASAPPAPFIVVNPAAQSFSNITLDGYEITGAHNSHFDGSVGSVGGGLFVTHVNALTLWHMTFFANHVAAPLSLISAQAWGGGLFADASSGTLSGCVFSQNTATGGALFSDFRGDSALGGGAYLRGGVWSLRASVFSHNQAIGGDPGNASTSTLVGGDARGGALLVDNAAVSLDGVELDNNHATGRGAETGRPPGGFPAAAGGNGGAGKGGAIYSATLDGQPLVVANTTFAGNVALGGDGSPGSSVAPGPIVFPGGAGGNGGQGAGGAIAAFASDSVRITGSVFQNNRAQSGNGGNGGNAGNRVGVDGPGAGGGNGGSPVVAQGGALYVAGASGAIDVVLSSFVGNKALSGSAGAGGSGGSAFSSGTPMGGGSGGDGGTVAAQAGAIYLNAPSGVVSVVSSSFTGNVIGGGYVGAGGVGGAGQWGGSSGSTGADGSQGTVDSVALALFGDVVRVSSCAFFGNSVENLTLNGPAATLGAYNQGVCADDPTIATGPDGSAASALLVSPFDTAVASGQLLLTNANACVDNGDVALPTTFGVDTSILTDRASLALDAAPSDSGAHFSPSSGLIISASGVAGVLNFAATGVTGCILFAPDRQRIAVPVEAGSVGYSGSGNGVLMCGTAAVALTLP